MAPADQFAVPRQSVPCEVGAADPYRVAQEVGLGVQEPIPFPELHRRFPICANALKEGDEGRDALSLVPRCKSGWFGLIADRLTNEVRDPRLFVTAFEVRKFELFPRSKRNSASFSSESPSARHADGAK